MAVPNTGGTRTKNVSSTLRSGFMQVTNDMKSSGTSTISYVGHIFGRLG